MAPPSQPDDEIAAWQSVARLRQALRRFDRQAELAARQAGLTPRQFLLLATIKGTPSGDERSRVGELATKLQLSQNAVTALVKRAEEQGLLARRRSESDRRVWWLSLTREGERRLRTMRDALQPERRTLTQLVLEELATHEG